MHRSLVSISCRRLFYPVFRQVSFYRAFSTPAHLLPLAEALKSSNDLPSIHRNASNLLAAVKETDQVGHSDGPLPAATDDRLIAVFQLLATAARPEDMKQLYQLLQLQGVLSSKPSPEIFTLLIQVLLENFHDEQLVEFLQMTLQLPGNFSPSQEELHFLLKDLSRFSSFSTLLDFVAQMPNMGQKPSNSTFLTLLDAFWTITSRANRSPTAGELFPLIDEMSRHGLPHDNAIADALYLKFSEAGLVDEATAILERYESSTSQEPAPSQSTTPSSAFHSLRHSRNPTDIHKLEEQLGVQCGSEQWAIIITNCLNAGEPEVAFDAYDQARKAGQPVIPSITLPLLRHLLGEKDGKTTESSIDLAFILYQHFLESTPPPLESTKQSEVYRTLIQLLATSSNPSKCLPILDNIVQDMESRSLPTDASLIATTRVVLEMRQAGKLAEVIEVYRDHSSKLDQRGFNAVLRELCALNFRGQLTSTFIQEYFSVVNDMRLQRIQINRQIYTTILFYIGNTATRLQRDDPSSSKTAKVMNYLIKTTRQTHDFLTLDASVSPDAALWNQLMNTYQRLDCFADAYRVWEMMYLTRRYNQISVNIVLDACGYAGVPGLARKVLHKLARAGFKLDRHNWNTWVECLCRTDDIECACKVACVDMPEAGHEPSVETFRIIHKFSQRNGVWDRIRPVLARHPEFWNRYAAEIETS